jgi:hypothetical protein
MKKTKSSNVSSPKLKLHRETLRRLLDQELRNAQGGLEQDPDTRVTNKWLC